MDFGDPPIFKKTPNGWRSLPALFHQETYRVLRFSEAAEALALHLRLPPPIPMVHHPFFLFNYPFYGYCITHFQTPSNIPGTVLVKTTFF